MSNFLDSHIHFDLGVSPLKLVDFYESNEIYGIFVINKPDYFFNYCKKIEKYKYIKLAVGFHPGLAKTDKFNLGIFERALMETKYVGEVGLDFYEKDTSIRELQLSIFDNICKISSKKIMSIHSRRAEKDILKILKNRNVCFPILHWYSGSTSLIQKFLDINCYFSVNINMLSSQNGIKICRKIPLDRILFETDFPFSKEKINLKSFVDAEKMFNEFYGINNFKEIVYLNFKRILNEHNKLLAK